MNKRFLPSVIALLSSCDFTLSFIPPVGKVNAATFSSGKKTTSRLFFYGDYGDNYFQGGGFNGDGYLHQVSNLRGGSYINDNKDTLSSLSVSELKRLLNDRGVDYRDCIEKRDLVERLMHTSPGSAPSSYSSSNGGSAGAGLSQEENRVVNTFTNSSPSVAYIQTISQQQTIRGFSLKGTEVPMGAGR